MNIVAVDDERPQLEILTRTLKKIDKDYNVVNFLNAKEAYEYIKKNQCDVAFLDINMRGISGIDLARDIKKIKPNINIIFCTGYSEYAFEAMEMHASGYVLKPVREERLVEELNNLRNPVCKEIDERVFARCFGSFELLKGGKSITFKYEKSKEIIAFLVDKRGNTCTNLEIMVNIWDDDNDHSSFFQDLRRDIKNVFKQENISEIIEFSWGKIRINAELIKCDYYDWLDGKSTGINAFRGEYMKNYKWAELKEL